MQFQILEYTARTFHDRIFLASLKRVRMKNSKTKKGRRTEPSYYYNNFFHQTIQIRCIQSKRSKCSDSELASGEFIVGDLKRLNLTRQFKSIFQNYHFYNTLEGLLTLYFFSFEIIFSWFFLAKS
jgi:hypothetical protein